MGGVPGQQHDSTMAVSSVIMCEIYHAPPESPLGDGSTAFASGLKALASTRGHGGGLVVVRRGYKRPFRCARIVHARLVDPWAALRSSGGAARDALLSQLS